MKTEYCTVEFHGERWRELVEQGWVTMYVDSLGARMIRQWKYGRILK